MRARAFFLQRVVFHLRPAFAVAPSDADGSRQLLPRRTLP